jgi:hypothetical protein
MKIKPFSKVLMINLVILLILANCAFPVFAAGDPGDSVDNPIIITTAAQLYNVRDKLSAFYKLGADIDLTAYSTDAGWEPIGTNGAPFTGDFDGAGHGVFNMKIDRPAESNVGLFGYVSKAAASEVGEIRNLNVEGKVSGGNFVGVIVGYSRFFSIKNCSSSANVTRSNSDVGGLVGHSFGGSITNCSSTGNVSGSGSVGGLVGLAQYTYIANCTTVSGPGAYPSTVDGVFRVGGLVGKYSGSSLYGYIIEKSYSNCMVGGEEYLGGLVGEMGGGYILNCYSKGSMNAGFGTSKVGGLAGAIYNHSKVINSYSNLVVTGDEFSGGLVGDNRDLSFPNNITSQVEDSFYKAGLARYDNGLGEPLDETEMMTKSIFTDSYWDFTNVWDIIDGYYTPFLRVSAPPVGAFISDCLDIVNHQNLKNPTVYYNLLFDAQKMINKGKFAAAREDLYNLISLAKSQSGKKISVTAAKQLISIANYIIIRIS